MRGWTAALVVALTVFPALAASDAPAAEEVKRAALEFGEALTSADAGRLRPLLPTRGKVRLHLVCLGPEEGSYSGGQVMALLSDFLRHGSVQGFQIGRVEGGRSKGYALAHGRARLTDREGKAQQPNVHLTFEREAERWVLREIRESPP